jgi:hypothetical protein
MMDLGYSFNAFVPDGDDYQVEGQNKYFFIGTLMDSNGS